MIKTNIVNAADVEETKRMFEHFDLQLFASDDPEDEDLEDVDDGGYTGEEDPEDEDDENDDDQSEDESESDDDEDVGEKDKKTSAIIKYKKQAKDAAKRAEEAERKLLERESSEFIDKEVKKLVGEGHSEERANEIAKLREENKRFKDQSLMSDIRALNAEFPGADQFTEEIRTLKTGDLSGLSVEEIFLAKFYKKIGHDLKTDAEQRAMHNAQRARQKNKVDGTPPAGGSSVKLTKQQQVVYNEVLKSHPTMTRKRFLELEDEGGELSG